MTAKKATVKLPKFTKEDQYAEALYMAYDDYDEMFSVLRYVINDIESEAFSKYQVAHALKAIRTLMITNQTNMMDMAGLEY
jgi:DNA-directed RNA polymerase subunit L